MKHHVCFLAFASSDRIQIPCASDSHPMEEGKKENGSAGSERDFETVTSESDCKVSREAEKGSDSFFEKNTCILEDVDGELEMEDVAPQCPNREVSASEPGKQPSSPVALAPPLPADKPPSPPPLPSSPPPAIPLFHPVLSVASRPVPLNHGDDQASHSFPSGNVSSLEFDLTIMHNFTRNFLVVLILGSPCSILCPVMGLVTRA